MTPPCAEELLSKRLQIAIDRSHHVSFLNIYHSSENSGQLNQRRYLDPKEFGKMVLGFVNGLQASVSFKQIFFCKRCFCVPLVSGKSGKD